MRLLFTSSLLALLAASVASAEDKKSAWTNIEIQELRELIASGEAHVIDNNPKFVYEKRRIPTAKWLNAKSYKKEDLPKETGATLVFYCMNDH